MSALAHHHAPRESHQLSTRSGYVQNQQQLDDLVLREPRQAILEETFTGSLAVSRVVRWFHPRRRRRRRGW